ncbi:MAG: DoxX family protein [Acidobacteriia bacterium]|nr:DoxX family protein [Terriglobia bacterium]
MFQRLVATTQDVSLTTLRLVLGVVFFAHGGQKMLGWFGGYGFHGTMGFFTHMGMPAAVAFLIICTEFFGGLGLIVGFLTRIAALGIGVEMIGAIFLVHLPNGFFMNWAGTQKGEGYEYHLLAIAVAAILLVRGAGAYSVDRALTD